MTQQSEQSIAALLAETDQFSVDWAERDEKGNLVLQSSVFNVEVSPAPMFGQNIEAFGFDQAVVMAENDGDIKPHDFGPCRVKTGSLRRESDGRWYVTLGVSRHRCRYPQVTTMLVEDDGETPILDENGNVQLKTAPKREAYITCALDMLKPDLDHPLCAPYYQRDRDTAALVATNKKSAAIAAGRQESAGEGKRGRGKGKRARPTPAQIAEIMAAQGNA